MHPIGSKAVQALILAAQGIGWHYVPRTEAVVGVPEFTKLSLENGGRHEHA